MPGESPVPTPEPVAGTNRKKGMMFDSLDPLQRLGEGSEPELIRAAESPYIKNSPTDSYLNNAVKADPLAEEVCVCERQGQAPAAAAILADHSDVAVRAALGRSHEDVSLASKARHAAPLADSARAADIRARLRAHKDA